MQVGEVDGRQQLTEGPVSDPAEEGEGPPEAGEEAQLKNTHVVTPARDAENSACQPWSPSNAPVTSLPLTPPQPPALTLPGPSAPGLPPNAPSHRPKDINTTYTPMVHKATLLTQASS